MVARINHGAHIEGVLFYNKFKTDKGEARVVLCHNLPIVPQDGKIDIRRLSEAFRPWMTHPRPRLGEPVFHVSLRMVCCNAPKIVKISGKGSMFLGKIAKYLRWDIFSHEAWLRR